MSRNEFIDGLRVALNGRISASQAEDTIRYYQDYINTEIRNGRSEAEVMAMLGDPRLIARTIVDTSQPAGDVTGARGGEKSYQDSTYRSSGAKTSYDNYQSNGPQTKGRGIRIAGWILLILALLVVYVIISVVFSVLKFLAPVILVVVAVVFLVKLFRDWLN